MKIIKIKIILEKTCILIQINLAKTISNYAKRLRYFNYCLEKFSIEIEPKILSQPAQENNFLQKKLNKIIFGSKYFSQTRRAPPDKICGQKMVWVAEHQPQPFTLKKEFQMLLVFPSHPLSGLRGLLHALRPLQAESRGTEEGILPDHWESESITHTMIMTRFEYEVRIYCQSQTKLKVVKWGWNEWNGHILVYIYHKQCGIMQKIQWKSLNG